MSLGDGVDFDPNSVRQRVRHEFGKTKMQAHVYGKETVRSELDGRTPPSQKFNSSRAARTDESITAASCRVLIPQLVQEYDEENVCCNLQCP